MSKRKEHLHEIDVPETKIGRAYKFWNDRSDKDFKQWLKLTGFISSRYRIAHIIFSIMLLVIGILELVNGSTINGVLFAAFGAVILVLLLIGSKVKE